MTDQSPPLAPVAEPCPHPMLTPDGSDTLGGVERCVRCWLTVDEIEYGVVPDASLSAPSAQSAATDAGRAADAPGPLSLISDSFGFGVTL